MDKINFLHPIEKGYLLFLFLLSMMMPASAEEALSSTIDCSVVEIDYIDNPYWTESERLAAMDRAFFESINRFELCNLSNQSSSSTADDASEDSGSESFESVASPSMTGTETESAMAEFDSSDESSKTSTEQSDTLGGGNINGTKPEDIPDADNDDVVASQIRLAAEIEQDPVKKEKLWNEYRKYKGLPVNTNE